MLATWVLRSTIRACRRNDVSQRSNCSVIGDAGSLSPAWAELHLALEGTTSFRTQKGFARQDGPQEESPGLKRSGGLSPSRHNFLPQARTTSLRVCMCRERALATCTIGPASLLVLALPLHFSSRNRHEKPCQASSSRHSCLESMPS